MKNKEAKPGIAPAKISPERIPAEVWLDYIEDETDPSLAEDLERLLSYRPEYQKTVQEIKTLKSHLKDTAQNLPNEQKFKDLKSQIMAAVEKTTPEKKISPWHRHNKAMTYTTMAMTAVVTGALLTPNMKGSKSRGASPSGFEDQLLAQNVIERNNLTEMTDDALVDALAEKLSQLPEKQALDKIEKLK